MAPQQRRARSRRLAVIAATVAASAALASGPGFAAGAGVVRVGDPPAPTPTVPAAAGTTPAPAVAEPTVPSAPAVPSVPVVPPVPAVPPVSTIPPVPVVPSVPAVPPVSTIPPVPAAPTAPPTAQTAQTPKPLEAGKTEEVQKDVPAFGAYLEYDAGGVARMAELSRWLGRADLRVGHTYLPGDRWKNIEGDVDFLDAWARWRNEKDDRMFVLNVPMQENNEAGVSDTNVGLLLRQGAAGAFDHHFHALAERLVKLRVPDTVIVLGWEMNGITYTHRCGPDPEAWKKYWNRIVTTMRAVPGQRFRFDFAPSRGRDAVAWTECYPGDDTVDIIGMDSYDQPSGLTFDQQVNEPYGLQKHVDFAKAHGKPISYPEWGLFRNGDNADYMRRMITWMDEHRPLYNTLTDYCPHGVWQCSANPASSAVYRSLLSEPTEPTTPPTEPPTTPTTPPTTPTTPEPTATCSPLELGDWVEYWLGGKLCLRFDWWSHTR